MNRRFGRIFAVLTTCMLALVATSPLLAFAKTSPGEQRASTTSTNVEKHGDPPAGVIEVTASCPATQTIQQYNPGDILTGYAQLSTTQGDPAQEATENENLVVTGIQNVSSPVTIKADHTYIINFTATTSGTITGCIEGHDSDETGIFDITLVPAVTAITGFKCGLFGAGKVAETLEELKPGIALTISGRVFKIKDVIKPIKSTQNTVHIIFSGIDLNNGNTADAAMEWIPGQSCANIALLLFPQQTRVNTIVLEKKTINALLDAFSTAQKSLLDLFQNASNPTIRKQATDFWTSLIFDPAKQFLCTTLSQFGAGDQAKFFCNVGS